MNVILTRRISESDSRALYAALQNTERHGCPIELAETPNEHNAATTWAISAVIDGELALVGGEEWRACLRALDILRAFVRGWVARLNAA